MNTKNKKFEKQLPEIIFLAVVFIFLLCWTFVQPFNVSPDEGMKFQVIEYIMKHGKLPHGGEAEIRDTIWGISYAFNPITSYIAGAVFGKIISLFTTESIAVVLAARMVNVLLGTATAKIVIKISRHLFKDALGAVFTVFAVFLPGALFIHSYINMDALALFSSAWIILCWIKAMESGWSVKLSIELGAALSVCALSYYNAYGFILSSVFFFGFSILFCEDKRWNFRELFLFGAIVTLTVLILAGWWFIRNAVIYQGDILGMRTSSLYGELYAMEAYKPSVRATPEKLGMTITDMFFYIPGQWKHNWIVTVATSFIGTFGYLNIFMPERWTHLYLLVFFIGLAGMLFTVKKDFYVLDKKKKTECRKDEKGVTKYITIRREKKWRIKPVFHVCMGWAMVIPFILLVKYSYSSDFQAQGRYLMPMLIPFMYFISLGYGNIMERIVKNPKIRNRIYYAMAVLYGLSAVLVYSFVFLPNYM